MILGERGQRTKTGQSRINPARESVHGRVWLPDASAQLSSQGRRQIPPRLPASHMRVMHHACVVTVWSADPSFGLVLNLVGVILVPQINNRGVIVSAFITEWKSRARLPVFCCRHCGVDRGRSYRALSFFFDANQTRDGPDISSSCPSGLREGGKTRRRRILLCASHLWLWPCMAETATCMFRAFPPQLTGSERRWQRFTASCSWWRQHPALLLAYGKHHHWTQALY